MPQDVLLASPYRLPIMMKMVPYFMAIAVASVLLSVRRLSSVPGARWTLILGVLAFVGTAVLPTVYYHRREVFYYTWYIVEVPVLSAILTGLGIGLVGPLTGKNRAAWGPALLNYVGIGLLGILLAYSAINFAANIKPFLRFEAIEDKKWQAAWIDAALTAKNELGLSEECVIGSWNSGAVAFFSAANVVNLDGLANDEAATKLKQEGLPVIEYVRQQGIKYIIDVMPMDGYFGNRLLNLLSRSCGSHELVTRYRGRGGACI